MKSCLLKQFPQFQTGSIAIHTTDALHASQNQNKKCTWFNGSMLSRCLQTHACHVMSTIISFMDSGKKELEAGLDVIHTRYYVLCWPWHDPYNVFHSCSASSVLEGRIPEQVATLGMECHLKGLFFSCLFSMCLFLWSLVICLLVSLIKVRIKIRMDVVFHY